MGDLAMTTNKSKYFIKVIIPRELETIWLVFVVCMIVTCITSCNCYFFAGKNVIVGIYIFINVF